MLSENDINNKLTSLFDSLDDKRPTMLQVSEDIPVTEWKRVLPIITKFMKNK